MSLASCDALKSRPVTAVLQVPSDGQCMPASAVALGGPASALRLPRSQRTRLFTAGGDAPQSCVQPHTTADQNMDMFHAVQ